MEFQKIIEYSNVDRRDKILLCRAKSFFPPVSDVYLKLKILKLVSYVIFDVNNSLEILNGILENNKI